jgi:acyl dehydratase
MSTLLLRRAFARRGDLADFYLNVGDEVVQERLVTGAAVDAFADVSGDHSPNHVDDETMSKSAYCDISSLYCGYSRRFA